MTARHILDKASEPMPPITQRHHQLPGMAQCRQRGSRPPRPPIPLGRRVIRCAGNGMTFGSSLGARNLLQSAIVSRLMMARSAAPGFPTVRSLNRFR